MLWGDLVKLIEEIVTFGFSKVYDTQKPGYYRKVDGEIDRV